MKSYLKTPAALIATLALGLAPSALAHAQAVTVQEPGPQPSSPQDMSSQEVSPSDVEFLALLDPLRAGEQAPSISFDDDQGNLTSLSDFMGKALVVNFWATWCAPCIAEMPALDRLNQALEGHEAQVVTINTDFAPEAGPQWLADNHIQTLEAYYDSSGNAFFDSGAIGMPHTFIVDRSGVIVAEVLGDAHWDTPAARNLLIDLASAPLGENLLGN